MASLYFHVRGQVVPTGADLRRSARSTASEPLLVIVIAAERTPNRVRYGLGMPQPLQKLVIGGNVMPPFVNGLECARGSV